jgi:hypothetical protein
MKRFEYVFAFLLIVIGIGCLTMSGSMMIDPSLKSYIGTLTQICLWLALPLLIVGIVYLLKNWRNRK